jgi:hypothetical protein
MHVSSTQNLLVWNAADILPFELEYARIIPKNSVPPVATQHSCVRQ